MTLRMSVRSERLHHTSNINDISNQNHKKSLVSMKKMCLGQSEHWILTDRLCECHLLIDLTKLVGSATV